MKKLTCPLFIAMMALSNLSFAEQVVVVHPSNNAEFDQRILQRIFLGKSSKFSDGETAVPINQAEGSDPRDEFNEQLLDKSASQLKSYWSKLVFTGKGTPPQDVDTNEEIINLISENPNMVGYIDASSVNERVRVVYSL